MYAFRRVLLHKNQGSREVTSLPKCQHVIKMSAENKLRAEPRLHFANREIKIHVYAKREFVPRDQVVPFIVVNCLLLQLKNKKLHASFVHKNCSGQFLFHERGGDVRRLA